MASNFRDGTGTMEEPSEPRVSLDVEISLKDANYLANLLEVHFGLKGTIFVKHCGRLLGVDAKAHVQFIRDREWSFQKDWKKKT